MLRITIPATELWDEAKEEFVTVAKEQIIHLEHSLVSLSKWEAKWRKPFITSENKTYEETIDYIKCMTITQNVNPEIYDRLSSSNINTIKDYIDNPMTATTFYNISQNPSKKETITSELIYYWMISFNIPMECQKWHLNRLITLIRVFEVKNTPPKKRSQGDIIRHNAALNAARRQKFNTKG